MLGDDLDGLGIAFVDQAANLFVDGFRRLFRVVLLLADLSPEEDELFLVAQGDGAEPLAHAVFLDHLAGDVGRLLDVVLGAGRDLAEDDLLGRMTAQGRRKHRFELAAGHVVAILGRQRAGVTAHHAARDNRHLVHRIVVLEVAHGDGVAALVVRRQLFFAI